MGSAAPKPRAYLRHPTDVPIRIDALPIHERATQRMKDVGLGGLSCRATCELDVGTLVEVSIDIVKPPFHAEGRVAWCKHHNGFHELGIQFMRLEDAFAARMVEQVCHIEHYRNEVLAREGRVIDSNTAACEWIQMHAADFPELADYQFGQTRS